MNHRRTSRAPFWLLVSGALAMFPYLQLIVFDNKVIAEPDYTAHQLPIQQFVRDEYRSGRYPAWLPQLACGTPLQANQAALCHPLLTPLVVLLPCNYGIRLATFITLGLALAGQYTLCRSFRISAPASGLASLAFTQSGFAIAHLCAGHINHILAYSLLPWFFWTLRLMTRAPGPAIALCQGLILASFVHGGHPQLPYYAVLMGMCWGTYSLAVGAAAKHRRQFLRWTAIAIAIGISMSLIRIVPILELILDGKETSSRGLPSTASLYAFRPFDLLMLLCPNGMGNPYAGLPVFRDQPNAFHERSAYVGILTLLCGAIAIPRSRRPRWPWACLATCIVGIFVALGTHTPVFGAIGNIVPAFLMFRCPGRILGVTSVFMCLLAGRGADRVLRGKWRPAATQLVAIAAIAWLASTAMVASILDDSSSLPDYFQFLRDHPAVWLCPTAFAAVALALVYTSCRSGGRYRDLMAYLMNGLLALDLAWQQTCHFQLREWTPATLPMATRASGHEPLNARYVHAPGWPYVSEFDLQYDGESHMAYGGDLISVGTNDGGMQPSTTQMLFDAIVQDPRVVLPVAACRYAIDPHRDHAVKIADALARVRFISHDNRELIDIPIGDLSRSHLELMSRFPPLELEVVHHTPTSFTIRCDAPGDGILVVTDTYYPGWRCTDNGQATDVFPVHGVFRGIELSQGTHMVEFEFDPLSLRVGAAGNVLGVVLTIFFVAWRMRR